MGWSGVVCSVLWLCAIYSCVLAQSVYFFSHFESVFMLTKLPLLSQWVTFWPPQDSAHVHVANTRHGGSGPGVWACVNTRHRWVAPWACCCSLPSAASSGCPDSNLIRLTVTRILISSNSVPPCWIPLCLSLTFSLTVTRSLSRLLYSRGYSTQGYLAHEDSCLHWERMRVVFLHYSLTWNRTVKDSCHILGKWVIKKISSGRNRVSGKKCKRRMPVKIEMRRN